MDAHLFDEVIVGNSHSLTLMMGSETAQTIHSRAEIHRGRLVFLRLRPTASMSLVGYTFGCGTFRTAGHVACFNGVSTFA